MGTQAASRPNPMQLLRMMDGLIVHQALYAAAKLGVADALAKGERSATELAGELNVKQDAVYRVMRFLAGQGVFQETATGKFVNTELSYFLRSDVPGSVRPMLIFRGSGYYFAPFAEFAYSVETGKSGREKLLGIDGFEYLREHPEEARVFDEAMTCISSLSAPAIAAAYDFGQWESLTDVGGGNGILLAAILRGHPTLRGVLADQAHVLERARERGFLGGELAARASYADCDFFTKVPAGTRAYLMKSVIHDWDDERSLEILRHCRRVVPDGGALLLVEFAVGEKNTPAMGKVVDLVMLAVTGGKERTVEEYGALLAAGGFRLNRTFMASGDVMVMESLPA
jgi:hypothetical protein